MKLVFAIVLGIISGFLIYMMGAMLTADFSNARETSGLWVAFGFFGGTALSAWLLQRGARTVSAVFRRGFLLGAAEWLCMAFVGLVFSGRAVTATVAQGGGSDAAAAGAVIGGGVIASITGGVSIFMAIVCLIGFTIAYFIGREMRDTTTTPTRKCPECAEMVQAEARKCR